jgi:hypothetical protein
VQASRDAVAVEQLLADAWLRADAAKRTGRVALEMHAAEAPAA